MDGEHCKRVPSVPSNFLTLAQLQERWLQKKQREKEEEEEEEARIQRQKQEEEDEEQERREKEKEDQQRKLRIQQTQKRQNENRERPRSNNVPPRPPFHRSRQNQCPGGGAAGDNVLKPEKIHVAEVAVEEAELNIDVSIKTRAGWKKREPNYRNRQNHCRRGGGAGDDELKPEETHIRESVAEAAEPKIDYSMNRRTGWKNRKPSNRNIQNQCTGGGGGPGDGELKAEETHIGNSVSEVAEPKTDDSMNRRTGWENRKPLNRNPQNQCTGGGSGDSELKAEEAHIGKSVAEVAEPKTDDSMNRRTGWKNRKPLNRNRQNQFPGGGSGDNEEKPGKTHIGVVVPEDVGLKIDDSIKKTGSSKIRGKPRVWKEDRTDDSLPEIGANREFGKGRIGEKKVWGERSGELERKFENISLCGGGGSGGEGFNGRCSGYKHGGNHHQNYPKDSGGIDWHRKRNHSNLVWVKKED